MENASGDKEWFICNLLHLNCFSDNMIMIAADVLNYVIGPYLHVSDAILLGLVKCQYTQPHGIITDNGVYYYRNGLQHREDGPAVEYGGDKCWFSNGKYHREDGPAIEWATGTKLWYINGKNQWR